MIQPIRNYNTQVECNEAMDILVLRALRQILRYSQDYLEDKIARRKEKMRLFSEEAEKMGCKTKDITTDIKIILIIDVNIKLNSLIILSFCTIPTSGDLPNLSAMILLCRVHTIDIWIYCTMQALQNDPIHKTKVDQGPPS